MTTRLRMDQENQNYDDASSLKAGLGRKDVVEEVVKYRLTFAPYSRGIFHPASTKLSHQIFYLTLQIYEAFYLNQNLTIIMDAIKGAVEGKMSQDARPGNSVEGSADNAANQS